jgi:hypothetical protein
MAVVADKLLVRITVPATVSSSVEIMMLVMSAAPRSPFRIAKFLPRFISFIIETLISARLS